MNGEKMYYLMHRDDIVTMVEMELETGSIVKISDSVCRELLPPGGNLSKDELKKWWKRRAVPVNQGNIEHILKQRGIPTAQNFLLQNCGLSLSDHYWMKPLNSDLTWDTINLYVNDFKDEIGDLQLQGADEEQIDLTGKTVFYPSASLQGELQKKWVIRDNKRYLIKGNYGASCQQSINEVIASGIHKKQNQMPFTDYQLCNIDVAAGVDGIGCISEDFSTAELEFISAYDVVSSVKKKNERSEYEHFISVCELNGLDKEEVRCFMEYQIMTDFVLTNTDRHFNNFGVLRDTHTLKFVGMAPIFDSGNSMFWNCPNLPVTGSLLDIPVNSFRKKEVEMLRYVTDRSLVHIDRLLKEEDIRHFLQKDSVAGKFADFIVKGYQRKIQLLEEFQSGENIWSWKYRG